jgi:hypothetical protein
LEKYGDTPVGPEGYKLPTKPLEVTYEGEDYFDVTGINFIWIEDE